MAEVRWSRSSPAVEVEPESETESPDRGPKAEVRRSGPSPEADFESRATKHSENIPKPNPNITTPHSCPPCQPCLPPSVGNNVYRLVDLHIQFAPGVAHAKHIA